MQSLLLSRVSRRCENTRTLHRVDTSEKQKLILTRDADWTQFDVRLVSTSSFFGEVGVCASRLQLSEFRTNRAAAASLQLLCSFSAAAALQLTGTLLYSINV